jgi:trehalose 6-phosphate synthase
MDIKRLVIVSNRLPLVIKKNENGTTRIERGIGGLVTAVGPVLRNKGGLWIGWHGSFDTPNAQQLIDNAAGDTGFDLISVDLSEEQVQKYYYGFSNAVLWPLFHDLIGRCDFDPAFWPIYSDVNRRFAEVIVQTSNEANFVWVQDYQLCMVARFLREMGSKRKVGFFLHIPFPPLDIFLTLPWRLDILKGLLAYDVIGFQTERDKHNFAHCVETLMPGLHVAGRGNVSRLTYQDRELRVGSFPISIDFKYFSDRARSREVGDTAWFTHEKLPGRKLILSVDRLDYTKGIPQRLYAIQNALQRYADLKEKVTFVLVVVPSRIEVPEYQSLKAEIEQLVGQVNGTFTIPGWTPVHYTFRALSQNQLLAYYRTCEVALITPLKDGMNLVAKEYCASSVDEDGVLILSEFAGSAAQLHRGAIMVNPHDILGVADAIHQAVTMDEHERRRRMRILRKAVQRADIFRWVDSYLGTAIAKEFKDIAQTCAEDPIAAVTESAPFR